MHKNSVADLLSPALKSTEMKLEKARDLKSCYSFGYGQYCNIEGDDEWALEFPFLIDMDKSNGDNDEDGDCGDINTCKDGSDYGDVHHMQRHAEPSIIGLDQYFDANDSDHEEFYGYQNFNCGMFDDDPPQTLCDFQEAQTINDARIDEKSKAHTPKEK